MPKPILTPLPLGTLIGRMPLAPAVLAAAADASKNYFAEQEAMDFCGDAVGSLMVPDWLGTADTWLPQVDLEQLGLVAQLDKADLIGTVGIDMHEDHINGLTLCLVLCNDGLKFQQRGKPRVAPTPGDWFLFDDAIGHAVHSTAKSTTFLCVTVPVQRLAR